MKLVKRLKSEGAPIDCVGFQYHEDINPEIDVPEPDVFQQYMKLLTDLGLTVRVSEIDASVAPPVTPEKLDEHAQVFVEAIDSVLKNPGATYFSMWGFTDLYSSLQPIFSYTGLGHGLLLNADFSPKPAFEAVINRLQN